MNRCAGKEGWLGVSESGGEPGVGDMGGMKGEGGERSESPLASQLSLEMSKGQGPGMRSLWL